MPAYVVSYKQYSERAGRYKGHPFVWLGNHTYRGRIPNDRASFLAWLKGVFSQDGIREGIFKILRHQMKGESAGCKCVAYGTFNFDENYVEILRFTEKVSGDEHKVLAGQSWTRQPFWQSERHGFESIHFKGIGKRFR